MNFHVLTLEQDNSQSLLSYLHIPIRNGQMTLITHRIQGPDSRGLIQDACADIYKIQSADQCDDILFDIDRRLYDAPQVRRYGVLLIVNAKLKGQKNGQSSIFGASIGHMPVLVSSPSKKTWKQANWRQNNSGFLGTDRAAPSPFSCPENCNEVLILGSALQSYPSFQGINTKTVDFARELLNHSDFLGPRLLSYWSR